MSAILKAAGFVSRVLTNFMATSGLEPTLLGSRNVRLISAGPGKVTFDLFIHKNHTNRMNILHGGTIASMVDLGGSLAVASMGLYNTGVSTDLNVTYLSSGGKPGDKIRVKAECEKMGKTLAFTHIKFYTSKGTLFARGSHTKFIKKALEDQQKPYTLPIRDRGLPMAAPKDLPEDLPEDVPEDLPKDVPEDLPKDVPEDLPKELPKDS